MPKPRFFVTSAIAETSRVGSALGSWTAWAIAVSGFPAIRHHRQPKTIGQKDAVQQPAFRGPGVVHPVIQRIVAYRRVARMRPQTRPIVARGGHVERVKAKLSWFAHG